MNAGLMARTVDLEVDEDLVGDRELPGRVADRDTHADERAGADQHRSVVVEQLLGPQAPSEGDRAELVAVEQILERSTARGHPRGIALVLDVTRRDGEVRCEGIFEARPHLQLAQPADVPIKLQLGVEMERPLWVDVVLDADSVHEPEIAVRCHRRARRR